jgi:acyl carrier protein
MSHVDGAAFRQILADEFQLGDVPAMGESFVEDLAFDSMDMVDVIVFLEELAGRPPGRADQYPVIGTVEDAYAYLRELCAEDALPSAGDGGEVRPA